MQYPFCKDCSLRPYACGHKVCIGEIMAELEQARREITFLSLEDFIDAAIDCGAAQIIIPMEV
jgi:hypothetical protein